MTAEDLDALAADVGRLAKHHQGCDMECDTRKALELARGYLSLRLVQADHERQIEDLQRERAALQVAYDAHVSQIRALQAAYDDMQAAYLRVCGEQTAQYNAALSWRQ